MTRASTDLRRRPFRERRGDLCPRCLGAGYLDNPFVYDGRVECCDCDGNGLQQLNQTPGEQS